MLTNDVFQCRRGCFAPLVYVLLSFLVNAPSVLAQELYQFNPAERQTLAALVLSPVAQPAVVSSNRYANLSSAAELGKTLFFDPMLSANQAISCASCHQPGKYFTDGKKLAKGTRQLQRHTPTVVGLSSQYWFYWDGRRDSLWAQALTPIEAEGEMAGDRVSIVRYVATNKVLAQSYRHIFGEFPGQIFDPGLPKRASPIGNTKLAAAWQQLGVSQQKAINRVFVNLGKAIAAYEHTLRPQVSRFDYFVEAIQQGRLEQAKMLLNEKEVKGLRLFIDMNKTQCLQCHNGSMFSNGEFHNTGTGRFSGAHIDYGRAFGLPALVLDEFNCLGDYSDAAPEDCDALRFLTQDQHANLNGAFKTPSLRNIAKTAPYFHDGRFGNLWQVLQYYAAPPSSGKQGLNELKPSGLNLQQNQQLMAFLRSLSEVGAEL